MGSGEAVITLKRRSSGVSRPLAVACTSFKGDCQGKRQKRVEPSSIGFHLSPMRTQPRNSSPRQSMEPSIPERRLSPAGQAVLTGVILITGLLVFVGAWAMSSLFTDRGKICLQLPQSRTLPTPQQSEDYELLRQTQAGERLIQILSAAYSGQRLRIGEQFNDLVHNLNSICHLTIFSINQETALLILATTSATGVVSRVILMAPRRSNRQHHPAHGVVFLCWHPWDDHQCSAIGPITGPITKLTVAG